MKLLEILQGLHPQFDYEKSEDFFADGLIDSFDLTRLIAALEEEFAISIGGEELSAENFKNLAALQALLSRHGIKQDS
ncbi:acyl carrier protein [Selenomonas sp. KH1T6]|uniref:acyl carrier protein n=1 Tax=Selenomonas sp. KH1T6 TaxID=3158784 RepID=UPI0008A7407A|nr:Phosphopantetheine attachment site [Selenomonas ruminantium]